MFAQWLLIRESVTMKTSAVMNSYVFTVSESKISSRMITKMFLPRQLVQGCVCVSMYA